MIFIPCKDGISHNEAEEITPTDATVEARVLADVTFALANAAPEDAKSSVATQAPPTIRNLTRSASNIGPTCERAATYFCGIPASPDEIAQTDAVSCSPRPCPMHA